MSLQLADIPPLITFCLSPSHFLPPFLLPCIFSYVDGELGAVWREQWELESFQRYVIYRGVARSPVRRSPAPVFHFKAPFLSVSGCVLSTKFEKNEEQQPRRDCDARVFLRLLRVSLVSSREEREREEKGRRREGERRVARKRKKCCRDPFLESAALNIPSEAALLAVLLGTARLTLHL